MGMRPLHSLQAVLLMLWLDPSFSFHVVSVTVLPAMVNETAWVGSSLFWQLNRFLTRFLIVVAIAKAAGWSAFKIMSLNHSSWHTCTDSSEKLWFGNCVLLIVEYSSQPETENLTCITHKHSRFRPWRCASHLGWAETTERWSQPLPQTSLWLS